MMEKLFSYGTLQLEKVQTETFGRLLEGQPDVLIGYVLSEVKIVDKGVIEKSGTDIHPVLVYSGNHSDRVNGKVFDITEEELKHADKYEVDDYVRTRVTFQSGKTAWVYIAAPSAGEGS